MSLIVLALVLSAQATEVIWLQPGTAADAERIGNLAGARRGPVDLLGLRAAATAWGPADEEAYRRLEQGLRDVRAYETRLDGELVIMADLAGPIAAVRVVRNEADRAALFSTLAYQGFAVDRFFADTLATDDRAVPYRVDLDGVFVEAPWMDAVALDPDRQVTPYDVAEAPQRVAYSQVQAVARKALPARIAAADLPAGARLVVDGRVAEVGATGAITLVPGRHVAHAEKDGHVLARWDLRLAPGERRDLSVAISDAELDAWAASFTNGAPGPVFADLQATIDALGGEIWVAMPRAGKDPSVWKVSKSGVEPVTLEAPRRAASDGSGQAGSGWSVALSAGGGWLSSGDFYTQAPAEVPRTATSVNAGSIAFGAAVRRDVGIARLGVGIDTIGTLGAHHTARYGDSSTRLRPYPHVAAGVRYAQVTAGYAFPHHPTLGLRASIPLGGSAEAVAGAWYGLATEQTRSDDTTWASLPLYSAWGGIGWSFGSAPEGTR